MPICGRDAAAIWYEDDGEGDAVLLVHGGLFDPMDGRRFWLRPGVAGDLVAAGYRVLVPDRRFAPGKTQAPFALHSWDVEAADLRAVLDHGGVAAAHVVAGSNGCSAAVRLALTRPDRVRSLLLCWPSRSDPALDEAFERAVEAIGWAGPAAYLGGLRAHGLPRPEAQRPGFPWGAALLADDHLATEFAKLPAAEAAAIVRASASTLLPGDLIRGVSLRDAAVLGRIGLPVGVMPAEPADAFHPAVTAWELGARIPGTALLSGYPVSVSPEFAGRRPAFLNEITAWFASARKRGVQPESPTPDPGTK
jgi:pimeloyl-ACP methyl ester carboxylesterase